MVGQGKVDVEQGENGKHNPMDAMTQADKEATQKALDDILQSMPDALMRTNTEGQMSLNTKTALAQVLVPLLVGVWVPIVFLMAAANMDVERCEQPNMLLWLRLQVFVLWGLPISLTAVTLLGACQQNKFIFKFGQRTNRLSGVVPLCLFFWGWFIIASSTSANCVNDDSGVNPRLLMLVVTVFIPAALVPLLCCVVFCTGCLTLAGAAAAK